MNSFITFHSTDEGGSNWFSGWFSWCPTSEKLLEIAESQILESKRTLFDCNSLFFFNQTRV